MNDRWWSGTEQYITIQWIYSLNAMSTLVLLSLGIYLCWWTNRPGWDHPPSSQCIGTDTAY